MAEPCCKSMNSMHGIDSANLSIIFNNALPVRSLSPHLPKCETSNTVDSLSNSLNLKSKHILSS